MRKLILTTAVIICTLAVYSQDEIKQTENFRFGFNVGANYSLLRSMESLPGNSRIYNGIGTKLGILMDYSLSDNFRFCPKAELVLNNSGVESTNNNSTTTYQVFPVSLDIMSHLVYSIGEGKLTPYLLTGPNFRLPLKNKAKSSTDFNNNHDLAIDFGIGLENRYNHLIFAPEIRYSYGLLNINQNPTFQTLRYRNISLVMNFKIEI